jgi:hypothetical protein
MGGNNKNDNENTASPRKEFSRQRIMNLSYLIILLESSSLCITLAIQLYVSVFQVRSFNL